MYHKLLFVRFLHLKMHLNELKDLYKVIKKEMVHRFIVVLSNALREAFQGNEGRLGFTSVQRMAEELDRK